MTEQLKLAATDGTDIHGHAWAPDGDTRLVVQVLHGMGEYALRYDTFAKELNAAGIAVVAHDFRGHGPNAELQGHYADKQGWRLNLDDCDVVNRHARERFPDTALVLLGHSMGSFYAQNYAMDYSLDGLILSGSTWPNKPLIYPGLLLAKFESLRLGRRGKSPMLDKMGFGDFNKRFQPARTDYDWLSRDDAQVDRYVNDPLCGGTFSTAFWLDVLKGMLHVGSDKALLRIPSDLPILITGGEDDPVGGDEGLGKLMLHYAQTMHQRLKIKIYEGGRHEMLFETNRDEVVSDLIDWLGVIAARHAS